MLKKQVTINFKLDFEGLYLTFFGLIALIFAAIYTAIVDGRMIENSTLVNSYANITFFYAATFILGSIALIFQSRKVSVYFMLTAIFTHLVGNLLIYTFPNNQFISTGNMISLLIITGPLVSQVISFILLVKDPRHLSKADPSEKSQVCP